MEYLIGVVLSVAVASFAILTGFDRERSFFATVAIVNASYYVLFAVQGASEQTLVLEAVVVTGFSTLAVLGFKKNLWYAVAAIVGHGVFDFFHHRLIDNPGVPPWWPGFCLAFDVIFGAFLAMRLVTRSIRALNAVVAPEQV